VSDRHIAIAAFFVGLLSTGGVALFPDLVVVWVGFFTIGIGGASWVFLRQGRWLSDHRLTTTSIVAVISALAFWCSWGRARQMREPPDVDLLLVDPKSVNIMIGNPTEKLVHQPKYYVGLWNLDHPERPDPLPIPTASGDYIRAHSGWGPNLMMDLPAVRPLVTQGDHLFGFAQALCPDCKRDHNYWVYIEHGVGGWYCELPAGQIINWRELFRRVGQISRERDQWMDEQAPRSCRKPIKNWP
jgi:hypothetical protein